MSRAIPQESKSLVLSGEPRVQLLPPSIRAREKARQTQRMMVLLAILAVVVSAGGYVFALVNSVAASLNLAIAQSQTADLLVQQADYAEGPRISGLVTQTEDLQLLVVSGEVIWDDVFEQIKAGLPAGSTPGSGTFSSRAPWEAELAPETYLRVPRVALLNLVVNTPTNPDATALSRFLRTIPGFADSMITDSEFTGGGYKTTISLALNEFALSGRFADEPTDGATETPTDTPTKTPAPQPTQEPTP